MPGVVRLMEANLAKLEQQEQKYTAELNAALAEYNGLKAQAVGFDPDELAMAQLEIRPQKERINLARQPERKKQKDRGWER